MVWSRYGYTVLLVWHHAVVRAGGVALEAGVPTKTHIQSLLHSQKPSQSGQTPKD